MGKSLNGKELGKGISQRRDGLYQARFVNRFGKRQTIYAKTYSEITKKLRDEQYEDEKQINVVDNSVTLNEWYEIWIKECKKNCRNTTIKAYGIQYNRIRESLGWQKLTNLNLIIIQKAFNELKSDASRHQCKVLLVDILNHAMKSDLINKNVAVSVCTKIDRKEKIEKRILTETEIQLIYKFSRNNRIYPFLVMALNTGMRRGEILGLTWDCIDFDKGIIRVEKTLCNLTNKGDSIYEFHPPKSIAGKRSIPMTKMVRDVLQEQKQWCEYVEKQYAPKKGFEDLVFKSKTNKPIHPTSIKDAINSLVQKINANNESETFEMFTPHSLRHTFATSCIAKGMKPKVLQKILGHSALQMTMDLYCHVLDDTLKDEMSLVAEMV